MPKPPKYAPAREDGLKPYVVRTRHFNNVYHRIEWAENLKDAKGKYGYTRMLYETVTVRRATPADVEAYAR